MTTEKTYLDAATKIMALVDNNPTEPFTLERRQIEKTIADILQTAADLAADEDDAAYQVGYDDGYCEGRDQATEDFENDIRELEEEVDDLRKELDQAKDDAASAFAEGYQTASKGNDMIETIKFD